MTKLTQRILSLAAFSLLALPGALAAAPDVSVRAVGGSAGTGVPDEKSAGVFGRVVGDLQPLSAVRVYAYQLADLSLKRVVTDAEGSFRFPELPAGLYKIIAHKTGFVPAVVMLARTRTNTRQYLELELAEQSADSSPGDDFWSVRDRIPADVLREINTPSPELRLADSPFGPGDRVVVNRVGTAMEAMTGVDQLHGANEAVLSGGKLGVEGTMAGMKIGLSGDYWRLAPPGSGRSGGAEGDVDGLARHLVLKLEDDDSELALSTVSQRLDGVSAGGEPIDFESHRLSWGQDFESSRAHVSAQYTSQANYYADNPLAPVEIPRASQSWEVEGSYTVDASERSSFQGGVRYRDRSVDLTGDEVPTGFEALQDERLDLFGRAGTRIEPTVLIEYGLYTTLRDGSLSLVPHGGLVLQLGDAWQASALASGRVSSGEDQRRRDFLPAFYSESGSCTQGEESCYKVALARHAEDGSSDLSVGAIHREIGETLRLFFNDDFFDHIESLYLVRGDQIPELQFGVSRRVTPEILAHLESNVGSGGGGVFYATDNEPYENSVRYLVTSLDTHFQGTDTGVFISFHHLEQELDPMAQSIQEADGGRSRLEVQRLQLMLTQDLNILMDVAADWAVKLNMEVSRGSMLFEDPAHSDDLRRRILGGFAVKF